MEELKPKLLKIIERSKKAIEEMDEDTMDHKLYIVDANNKIIYEYWKLYNSYKSAKRNWEEKKNIPVE